LNITLSNATFKGIAQQGNTEIYFNDLIREYCSIYTDNFTFFIVLLFMAFSIRFYILPYAKDGFTEMWKLNTLSNDYYKTLLAAIDGFYSVTETALLFAMGYFLYIGWILGYSTFQLIGLGIMTLFVSLLFTAQIIGRFKRWKYGKK